MIIKKGFLLFELVCSLAILITGIQAAFLLQAASLRIAGDIAKQRKDLLRGSVVLEQKTNFDRINAYGDDQRFTVEHCVERISMYLPKTNGTNKDTVIIKQCGFAVIKDKKTPQIVLVG